MTYTKNIFINLFSLDTKKISTVKIKLKYLINLYYEFICNMKKNIKI